jgi:hypothetical protein
MHHCPTAAQANLSSGEARGGHEKGVELLVEARRAPEPPLTVVHARRSGAATVNHLVVVPLRVSSRVRTPLSPTSFCPQNPASTCPRELKSEASVSPPHGATALDLCESSARRWRARIRLPIRFCFKKS